VSYFYNYPDFSLKFSFFKCPPRIHRWLRRLQKEPPIKCSRRIPRWLNVETSISFLFLGCPPRISRWLRVEASKGVSNH
jgi:hypothetical protein